uniref:Uncharacterized protein n=1 Tax=Mus musculus TaxID=10090 RepID=Q3TRP2_MOUSE|nr:unnamed protein product [Mus musculus]
MTVHGAGKCPCRRKSFPSMARTLGNCSSPTSFLMFPSLELSLLKVMPGIFLLRTPNPEALGTGGYPAHQTHLALWKSKLQLLMRSCRLCSLQDVSNLVGSHVHPKGNSPNYF